MKKVFQSIVLLGALAALMASSSLAVTLDDENRIEVTLNDGTIVPLIGKSGGLGGPATNEYYSLPTNLRLSTKGNEPETPEFLFLKYTSDEVPEAGGVSGAILHFLVTWGLTGDQEAELRNKLESDFDGATYAGAVPLLPDEESGSYQLISATLSDGEMVSNVITSGKAPLIPGGKAAAAAKMDKNAAQIFAATLEETTSITDLSIAFNFKYTTLMPAVHGRVIFDWSRYQSHYEELKAEYEHKTSGFWWWKKHKYSYNEMRSCFDYLTEKEVIRMEYQEVLSDERIAVIRDAFFQFFLNSFAQADNNVPPIAPTEKEKAKSPNIKHGRKYEFSQTFLERSFQRKKQVFDLNARLAVNWPIQLVGNVASWYDAVKDNPKCVGTVNLSDPFFQHRQIICVVDLDAEEMFDDIINYATINLKKARNYHDFQDHITIDRNTIKNQGVVYSTTYSRGDDTNPDRYQYQVQWSLRSGEKWPANPKWNVGEWEGVTIAIPIVPRTIELEADIDELEQARISRVTAQVLYSRFGKVREENIQLRVASKEGLVTGKIFMDNDYHGYVYRLIFNHKDHGKLSTDWETQFSDDYIYASIPLEWADTTSTIFTKAVELAEDYAGAQIDTVLTKFEKIRGGIE